MATSAKMLAAEIRNEAWLVRHYCRNRLRREQAVLKLGLAVRNAFAASDEFEPLLAAILDGLRPTPEERHPF